MNAQSMEVVSIGPVLVWVKVTEALATPAHAAEMTRVSPLTPAWLPTPMPLTLPTLLLPTLTTMLLLLLMPLLLLLLLLPLRRWPAIQARLCSAGGFKRKSGVPTCR